MGILQVEYLFELGVTKFAVIDVHDDDYAGSECGDKYPLLNSVYQVISENNKLNCSGLKINQIGDPGHSCFISEESLFRQL